MSNGKPVDLDELEALRWTDNEATGYPWWAIVNRVEIGTRNRYAVLAGPFFSRESAERQRKARLYEYGEQSLVYCFSGHESADYKLAVKSAHPLIAELREARDQIRKYNEWLKYDCQRIAELTQERDEWRWVAQRRRPVFGPRTAPPTEAIK